MTDSRFYIRQVVRKSRRQAAQFLKHPILVSSFLIASCVLGARQLAWLQPLELLTFDQMVRLRPEPEPDPRLLVVEITEEDIRAQNRWPLSDQVVADLLTKLQTYQPRAIGLDIYRDVPHPPGHSDLTKQLKAPNVVSIRLIGTPDDGGVAAPPGVPEQQIGFSDLLVDPDTTVRRNLLYAKTKSEQLYSFSFRLSLLYLSKENITFQDRKDYLQVGNKSFLPLNQRSAGYQKLDDLGYQILLNYRSANHVARQVTLTQVLNGTVNPNWVKDKLVLIGTTAPSAKDLFLTPYNQAADKSPSMPGVLVHAQMASQILSTVLDGKPLFWYWSEVGEIIWILSWSGIGGILAWKFKHPFHLAIAIAVAGSGLFGICFGLFLKAGWIPLLPSMLTLIGTALGVLVYRLLHDAFHDSLTNLPNRTLFTKQLRWAIAHRAHLAKESTHLDSAVAVLFLGLDGFKAINDSFGHYVGDQLLVVTTQRLKSCLHPTDQLARVGGDEFAILRRNVRDTEEVTHLADLLQKQITLPFQFNGQEVFTTASVGIVLDRLDSNYQPEDVLRDAHTAMHRAKLSGKARNEVFVTGMRMQVITRLQMETDLRHAIDRQEFLLHYQPLVSLSTGKIAGFEALVRWQHPKRGLVAPMEFIPITEDTDLIIPLGKWILHEACQQLQIWQEKFPQDPPLLVSVNLSSRQFSQIDLVEQIEQSLQETGLDGQHLKLEITESTAMVDVEETIALLLRLKALNLQLSIDDFGTGYSSLSYLHRLPTNTIKVDRSFVSRMGYESEDTHIVQTIIMLGHNLGMEIVAEGIETAGQLTQLRELNCEYGQGYFFSRPLSVEAIERLLNNDPKW